jgi:hypothetical protein
MTKINIGHGTFGDIFADLDKVKTCNYCKYFKGYGLHAVCGHCDLLNKDISGGYCGEYAKVAKSCNEFSVREELLEENIKSNNKIDYDDLMNGHFSTKIC